MMMGILQELKDAYENMCLLTGKKARTLVGSGNGIRKNPVMRTLVEAMFGMELKLPRYEEEAACGAALCSLAASGRVSSVREAQKKITYMEETETKKTAMDCQPCHAVIK